MSFVVHALHATLVERGIFDEIIWMRLPPDHSHDEIDRFFSLIEAELRKPDTPEAATLLQLIRLLRDRLRASKFGETDKVCPI